MTVQVPTYDGNRRKMEIARQIRKARTRRGLTQIQVAEILGCSRIKLNRVEQGQAVLSSLEIDHLASTFGLPVGYFFSLDDE
jgi:transcriptional regulator with XRE-family HTH domain